MLPLPIITGSISLRPRKLSSGDSIIIGEEIMTAEGELVGLFLQTPIPAGLSLLETATRIRAQGALVYVPIPLRPSVRE